MILIPGIRLFRFIKRCGDVKKKNLSFHDFNIEHGLVKRLNKMGIREPTDIQLKTWDHLQAGKSVVINSETGSGKTLAYVLPIVHCLQTIKRNDVKLPSPYALIITPNVELAYQVGNTFRHLSSRVCVANEDSPLIIKDNDIIITTTQYINTYPLNILNEIQTLVIDEADLLIARKVGKHGKKDPLFNLTNHFLLSENFPKIHFLKRQFVFVGATMPDNASKKSKLPLRYIKSWIPDIEILQVTNTHKLTPFTQMEYINVLDGNKTKLLVQCVREYYLTHRDKIMTYRIIVFVNKLETATYLHEYLTKKPLKDAVNIHEGNDYIESLSRFHYEWKDNIYLLHKKIPLDERLYTFERFSTSQNALLITTDVSSRGLDFPNVDLVIQYDFATNVIDVIHRAGRTARMGKQGKVINFITPTNEELSRAIQSAVESGQSFDALFSRHRSLQRKLKRQAKGEETLKEQDDRILKAEISSLI